MLKVCHDSCNFPTAQGAGQLTAGSWKVVRGLCHSKAAKRPAAAWQKADTRKQLFDWHTVLKALASKWAPHPSKASVDAHQIQFQREQQRQQLQVTIPSSYSTYAKSDLLWECCLWGAFPENVSGSCITGACESQVVNLQVLIVTGKLKQLLIDSLES